MQNHAMEMSFLPPKIVGHQLNKCNNKPIENDATEVWILQAF